LPPSTPPAETATGAGTVCAIVVTHNRVALLRRCLEALRAQSRPVDRVLVVDSASTDGSVRVVEDEFPEVALLALDENVGGAGGFRRGMAWAHQRGYDWLWLMDDDTLASRDALAALLAGAQRAPDGVPLLVASHVLWKDDQPHPMNIGLPRWRARGAMAQGAAAGLLLMRYVTFVSVAVRREAIDRFGLPLEEYFIWGDDVEFTSRVLKAERGYLVPDSLVHHWTATRRGPESVTDGRFYYHVRNSLLLLRGSALTPAERVNYGRWYFQTIVRFLRATGARPDALSIVARGLRDGLRLSAR